jgi:tetratricopeptide (TPR) repeat protein
VRDELSDLPAPRAKTPDPRRSVPPEVVDLPGPRATAPDLVAPKRPIDAMPSEPVALELEDLPGTRKRAAETQTTALQPKRGIGDSPSTELQPKRGIGDSSSTELEPKRGIGDSPSTELEPKRGIDDPSSTELQPKRGIDAILEELDTTSPGATSPDLLIPIGSQAARDVGLVPSAQPRPDEPELVRPKRGIDALINEMTPMPPNPGDSGEVALDGFALEDSPGSSRKEQSVVAALRKSDPDLAGQLEPSPLPSVLPPPRPEPEPSLDMVPKPPKKRRVRFSFIVVGSLVLFTGVAMAWIALTDAKNSIFGDPSEQVAVMNSAKNFLADDTITSSHKAVNKMHNLLISDQKAKDARALETEAHLIDVMAGINAELRPAEDLIADMDSAGDHGDAAETARAMRAIVGGNFPDAESKLTAVLARSPKDPMAQTALGWTHLAAGNAKGALADFKAALAIEPSRTAAHVGLARAAELLGDTKTAGNEYGIAFKSSPQHLGAEVGRERYASDGAASEKRLQDAIKRIDKNAGPHDLVDAWTLLGTRSYQAGRYDEAQERLKRAITQDPQATGPRLALAHALCDSDKAVDAVTPIDAVLAKEPKNLEALFLMVNAQLANHQPALAEPFVDRAFAIAPKDPRTYYWKGRVAETKNAADKAAAAYKDSVAADPHFLDGYVALSALYRSSKPEEALATLKKAEVQVASDPLLSTKLAEVYLGLGDATHAESCLRAVTTANPTMSRARLDLSQALVQLNRLDDADKELKDLATRDPRLTGLAERRAQLAVARKQLDDAAKLYVKALAEPSPRTSTVAAAARVQLDLGHFDEARKLYDRVVTEEPRNLDAQLGRARIELQQGHYIEAIQAARKSLTVADNPMAHLISGQANEKLGKPNDARTEYTAAATGATEFDARIGLARMLVARGAVKDAHLEAERAAKLQPGRAEPKMIMGDCESELAQHDKARHSYEEAVALDGNNAEAAFKLGRANKDAGKLQPAIAQLERATKLGGDKATFAPEAWLLLAESLREGHDRDPAVHAFKKYLEIAPPSAPERKDVQQTLRELGEK